MFGLHRRWRAAAVGHLALFEMTSVGPMGRYSDALARLGVPASARRFYDVHVTADAVHERIALDDMVADLVDRRSGGGADVVFGARALALVESPLRRALLRAWRKGDQALLARRRRRRRTPPLFRSRPRAAPLQRRSPEGVVALQAAP